MGGGNSRLNVAEGEVVPVKIRPLLRRRFEELRKRRNGGTLHIEGTLSKKQLLKDGDQEEDQDSNSQSSHETETETETETQNKEKEPAEEDIMVVHVISIEKLSRVVPLEEEKDPNTEQDNQEKVFHVDAVAEVEEEEEKTRENIEQEVDAKSDDDDNNNDDDESEEYGRLVYPGSPSFRIYCIEADRRKEEEEESKNQIIAMHKKSHSADSVASAASRDSNEVIQVVEIESIQKKKGNRIKKFGAVKTLLKVKSCYHPMCTCTGDDRSRLLVAKAMN